jgi:hypothetical protein
MAKLFFVLCYLCSISSSETCNFWCRVGQVISNQKYLETVPEQKQFVEDVFQIFHWIEDNSIKQEKQEIMNKRFRFRNEELERLNKEWNLKSDGQKQDEAISYLNKTLIF